MLFMVQPGLFKSFCKKRGDELKASGLDARFLYHIVFDEWIGSEDEEHAVIGDAHVAYGKRVTEMLDDLHARIRSGKKDMQSVAFHPNAKAMLNRLQKRNLALMSRPELAHCRDFLAKMTGHIARMAAKNHVFLGRDGEISVELVEGAEEICWYHFGAYQWTHNPLDQELQRERDAFALAQWLQGNGTRQLDYRRRGEIAIRLGMTPPRLRSAIGELFNQDRARFLTIKGMHFIEVLPPIDAQDNSLNRGGIHGY
jgi:hypothetical protein